MHPAPSHCLIRSLRQAGINAVVIAGVASAVWGGAAVLYSLYSIYTLAQAAAGATYLGFALLALVATGTLSTAYSYLNNWRQHYRQNLILMHTLLGCPADTPQMSYFLEKEVLRKLRDPATFNIRTAHEIKDLQQPQVGRDLFRFWIIRILEHFI